MTAIAPPPFVFYQGTQPLLVSMPHAGTYVPPPPEYQRPNKNWRLKQGAVPHWYKARNGVRSKAQSGAARVARFRPPKVR